MLRLTAFLAALVPAVACAHPAAPAGSSSLQPWLVALLALSAAAYALGLARLWRRAGRGRGITGSQAARFATGWTVLVAALLSPVDSLGAELFSMHMVQHELLMVVAAPLLVLGRPLEAWTWALPPGARRALGAFGHASWLVAAWAFIVAPVAAWSLHALALWAWHVPALFQAGLRHEGWHVLQHASFLGTALLFWWSVLGRGVRAPDAASVGSLFATMMHTGALGALLTFSPVAWYGDYADTAAFGLSAVEDQQLGGLVMWMPGSLSYLVAGLATVGRWLRRDWGAAAR